MRGGIAGHRVPVAVERVEAAVREPGLVEVHAVETPAEQLRGAPGVVAEPVVGGVRDHGVRGHRPASGTGERVGCDRGPNRLRREPRRRDRPDQPEMIARRRQPDRHGPREHEPLLDRGVAVAIAKREIPRREARRKDNAVGGGSAPGDAVRALRTEDARRVALALPDRTRVVEKRSEPLDRDRKVGAQEALAEVLVEGAPGGGLEERGPPGVPRRMPGVLVFPREGEQGRGEGREEALAVALHRRHDTAGDEVRSVLEHPDELVGPAHHLRRERRGFTPLGHQEDRNSGVAGADHR